MDENKVKVIYQKKVLSRSSLDKGISDNDTSIIINILLKIV